MSGNRLVHIIGLDSSTMLTKPLYSLGYLIEGDANLQQTAAIADHLIPTLANYLRKNDLNDEDYARMREVLLFLSFHTFIFTLNKL